MGSAAVVAAALGLVGGIVWGIAFSPRSLPGFVVLVTVTSVVAVAAQAAIYNVVARHLGGLRIDLAEPEPEAGGTAVDTVSDEVVRCVNCGGLEDRNRTDCRFCGESL